MKNFFKIEFEQQVEEEGFCLDHSKAFGRVKKPEERWSSYFSPRNSSILEICDSKMRELLGDGAYGFNEAVHNIDLDKVVGREEIFLLAYKHPTQDFKEDIRVILQVKCCLDY